MRTLTLEGKGWNFALRSIAGMDGPDRPGGGTQEPLQDVGQTGGRGEVAEMLSINGKA